MTICLSSYMIIYSGAIYRWLALPLSIFEKNTSSREVGRSDTRGSRGRCNGNRVGQLRRQHCPASYWKGRNEYLGWISIHRYWRRGDHGIPVVFGDIGDPEFLDNLPLRHLSWIVSTVRDKALNLTLVDLLKGHRYEGKIALAAMNEMRQKYTCQKAPMWY